jgi:hypothetical protein
VPTIVPAPPLEARFGGAPMQDPATSWQVVEVPGAPPSPPLAPLAMPEPSLKATTPARATPSLVPQAEAPAAPGSWMPIPAPALPADAATVIRGGSSRDEARTFDAAAPKAESTRPLSVASLPLPPMSGGWVAQTSQGPQPTPSPAPTASAPLPPLPPLPAVQLMPPPPLPPMPSLASHTPIPPLPRTPSLAAVPAPPPSAPVAPIVTPIRESRIDEKRPGNGVFSSLGSDPAMWLAIAFALITALVFVAAMFALAAMIN